VSSLNWGGVFTPPRGCRIITSGKASDLVVCLPSPEIVINEIVIKLALVHSYINSFIQMRKTRIQSYGNSCLKQKPPSK